MKFPLFALIVLLNTAFAEDYLPESEVEKRESDWAVCAKSDHQPVNGTVASYFGDGALKSLIEYKNGKEDGMRRRFYQSGRVMLEQEMLNGAYGAKGRGWHDNGRQYFEVLRKEPYNIVTTVFWDRNGKEFTDEYLDFRGDWPYRHISDGLKLPLKDHHLFKTGWCSNSAGRTMEEAVAVFAWNGPAGRKAEEAWIAAKFPDARIIKREAIETFDVIYTWYSIKRPGVFLPLTIYFDSTDHYGIF